MKIRVIIILMLFISVIFFACEEDDVCVGEGTPFLTVVFRNPLNDENRSDTLTIESALSTNFENPDTIYVKSYTDSVKLPLGGLDDTTSYFRITRSSNVTKDILTVNYSSKSNYVSKACGFRITYDNLDFESTFNLFDNIIPLETTLENESLTNLYIVLSN